MFRDFSEIQIAENLCKKYAKYVHKHKMWSNVLFRLKVEKDQKITFISTVLSRCEVCCGFLFQLLVCVSDVPAAERDEMKRKSVKEGESVTLYTGMIRKTNDLMKWYFNDALQKSLEIRARSVQMFSVKRESETD